MCGNFGLLLLEAAQSPKVRKLLETMIRVTMMRGAQSAGIVTYTGKTNQGIRKRVVNGKRTDLCDLLMRKCAGVLHPSRIEAPQLFQGHTRFATPLPRFRDATLTSGANPRLSLSGSTISKPGGRPSAAA